MILGFKISFKEEKEAQRFQDVLIKERFDVELMRCFSTFTVSELNKTKRLEFIKSKFRGETVKIGRVYASLKKCGRCLSYKTTQRDVLTLLATGDVCLVGEQKGGVGGNFKYVKFK